MDDLVFGAGFDPGYIEGASPARIIYWHERAIEYYRARNAQLAEQRQLDDQITSAVKALPRA